MACCTGRQLGCELATAETIKLSFLKDKDGEMARKDGGESERIVVRELQKANAK